MVQFVLYAYYLTLYDMPCKPELIEQGYIFKTSFDSWDGESTDELKKAAVGGKKNWQSFEVTYEKKGHFFRLEP